MIVFGADREIAQWVGDRLGLDLSRDSVALGIVRRGKLVAGVVYNNYRAGNIEMTIASDSPMWATRQALAVLFRYPFHQLKCRRVTAVTKATNQPVRAFLCRLGFQQEGILRLGFEDDDAAVFGMLRSECKWLAEEIDEQEQPESAASA